MKRIAMWIMGIFMLGTLTGVAQTGYNAWITTDGAGIVINGGSRPQYYYPRTYIIDGYGHHGKKYRKHAKKRYKKYRKARKEYYKAQKDYYKHRYRHHDWDDWDDD